MRKIQAMMLICSAASMGSAHAATATASFSVTAALAATCSATATTLAFPAYLPGTGAVTGTSNISVKCTKNTTYTVALNAGSTTGATIAQRLMAFGASHLQYNLYTVAGGATIFGDGTGGSQTVGGTGAGVATAQTVTVYGQLPDNATNQAVLPGNYSDLITVTVTY